MKMAKNKNKQVKNSPIDDVKFSNTIQLSPK
jgi:hypothetical protein